MTTNRSLKAFSKLIRTGCTLIGVVLGLLMPLQQTRQPAIADGPRQAATPTRRPVPKFGLNAVAGPSPKVDGQIGGEQVRMQADLPSSDQPGRQFYPDLFKFKLREDKIQNGTRAIFIVRDSNGNEVYKHTENNVPYCLFGNDSNQPCRGIPSDNEGYLYWPESDGRPAQPVQPGRYFLSAFIKNGNNIICNTIEDFVFDIKITFEASPPTPAQTVFLPASAGSAAITLPVNDQIWQGIVTIRGTATVRNFAYYKFEFEDSNLCQPTGGCFVADAKRAVRNGVLYKLDTRKFPNGTYLLRLLVVDRAGRVLSTIPRITITIQN